MGILKDFRYHSPKTVAETLKLLDRSKDAMLLAGGTFVLNHLKKAQRYPADVIGLKKITALKGIKVKPSGVSIGSMTTVAELTESKTLRQYFPSLAVACQKLATTPLRNMATIGGNVASRFFWVDLPAVLISLGAAVTLVSAKKKETISIQDFLKRSISKSKKNLLTEILLPKKTFRAFYFRHTKTMEVDIPTLALAFSSESHKTELKNVKVVVNTASSFPVDLKNTQAFFEAKQPKQIDEKGLMKSLHKDLELLKLDEYRKQCLCVDIENLLNLLTQKG